MSGFAAQLGGGLWALAAFIVLLGVIITVHEWGHYFVARRCGVHVIRFSIGFGKPLWTRTGRDGTEYVVAALPLGGYVRMLDERESPVPPERLHEAFNRKPVGQRFAIVAAGPLVNLVFAVLVYWLLFVVGVTRLAPVVGEVLPASPAAVAGLAAGDEILAIDDVPVQTWDDLGLRLVSRAGESGDIRLRVRAGEFAVERELMLPVAAFLRGEEQRSPTGVLGILPVLPAVEPVIGQVMPDSPAAAAGLAAGDRVLAVDGEPVTQWDAMAKRVRASPGEPLPFTVERAGQQLSLSVTPRRVTLADGTVAGQVGAAPVALRWPDDWPAPAVREVRYGPLAAVGVAVGETWHRAVLTVDTVGKMLRGMLSVDSLAGPISIARGAGTTAAIGLEPFLSFMAFLSISIGILNLLPIPVLDGGHLVFYTVEALRGRPVSERVQAWALQVGVVLLVGIMLIAVYNDLARL